MCGRALRASTPPRCTLCEYSTLIQGLGVSLFIFSLASHTAGVLTVTTHRNSIKRLIRNNMASRNYRCLPSSSVHVPAPFSFHQQLDLALYLMDRGKYRILQEYIASDWRVKLLKTHSFYDACCLHYSAATRDDKPS